MAHSAEQSRVDAAAAAAMLLLDNDHSEYDGATYASAKATSPFKPGMLVYADLEGDAQPVPRRVLIHALDMSYHQHSDGSYRDKFGDLVDHIVGFIERKNGKGFSPVYRHIVRGEITRGYEKARKLGLLPADAVGACGT